MNSVWILSLNNWEKSALLFLNKSKNNYFKRKSTIHNISYHLPVEIKIIN